MKNFIRDITEKYGEDFYVFGEFWNSDEKANNDYLENIDYRFDLVDVKLHHNLFDASKSGADYDLRTILINTCKKSSRIGCNLCGQSRYPERSGFGVYYRRMVQTSRLCSYTSKRSRIALRLLWRLLWH